MGIFYLQGHKEVPGQKTSKRNASDLNQNLKAKTTPNYTISKCKP
jgi:hypothetical protein